MEESKGRGVGGGEEPREEVEVLLLPSDCTSSTTMSAHTSGGRRARNGYCLGPKNLAPVAVRRRWGGGELEQEGEGIEGRGTDCAAPQYLAGDG